MNYHCKHCGKTVKRLSTKAWISSYCDKTGRMVHLVRCRSRVSPPNGYLHTHPLE